MIEKLHQGSYFFNRRLKDLTEGLQPPPFAATNTMANKRGSSFKKRKLATTLLDQQTKPVNQANQQQIWVRIKHTNGRRTKVEEYFFQDMSLNLLAFLREEHENLNIEESKLDDRIREMQYKLRGPSEDEDPES